MDVKLQQEPGGRPRLDVQFRKTKTDQLAFGCTRSHYPVADGARGLCIVDAVGRILRAFPERRDGDERERSLFRWRNGTLVRREDLQKALERAAEAAGLPRPVSLAFRPSASA